MDRPLRIVIGESPETCGMAAYHVDLVVFATYPESDSGRPKMHLVSPFAVATEVGVSRLGGVGVAFGGRCWRRCWWSKEVCNLEEVSQKG